MKKLSVFFLVVTVTSFIHAQNVYIPDANFRSYLLGNPTINLNNDNEIQLSEAIAFNGTIDCSGKEISSLVGIESFINLKELICEFNNLTSLDLSKNKGLISLRCMANKLTTLDMSNNLALVNLSCYSNQITNLNISKNIALKSLDCYQNQLTRLDVSQNLDLNILVCDYNQLTNLDLSKNLSLVQLECEGNKLTSIDVSKNLALTGFNCGYNRITNLDVSKNILLGSLSCYFNQLTVLDVTKNTDLRYLSFSNNQISSINVKNNAFLIRLNCSSNHLSDLDLSNNKSLDDINCSSNQLTSLNIRNGYNYKIVYFYAINNPNLSCIQVDNVSFANTNSSYKDWQKDETASYNTNCNLSVIDTKNNNIHFYPNPVKEILRFSDELSDIRIIEASGKIIKHYQLDKKFIDISNLSKGVYIINATTRSGNIVNEKIVKQ